MTKRSKRPPKVPDRERPVGREATRAKNPSTSSSGSVESAAESPQDQATLATSRGIIAAFVGQGSYLVIASWVGTAVLVVVSILGLVARYLCPVGGGCIGSHVCGGFGSIFYGLCQSR